MLSLSEPTEIGTSTNRTPIVLAPMRPEDAPALGAAFSVIDPWVRYPLTHDALAKFLGTIEPSAPRYLIREGGDAAGTLTVRLNWLGGPYLQFLAVVPTHQKNGIGALALSWFEGAARKEKARNLWVAASDFNAGAIRLYERHGFQRVAVIDSLIADGLDEVLMRKKL